MMALVWTLLVANLAGFGTWLLGWWVVPIVGLAAAIIAPRRAPPVLTATVGVALGWGVLLVRDARAPGFAGLFDLLGQLLPVPPVALVAAAVGLGTLLGAGGALLGSAIRPPRRIEPTPPRGDT